MHPENNKEDNWTLKIIPDDINAELLFSYLPEGKLKVEFEGSHKRNAYHDILRLEQNGKNEPISLQLGRNGLYNTLPEMLFHPIDRFEVSDEKEEFEEKYTKQKKEQENAKKFFAPIDLLLFKLRLLVREKIQDYLESDKLLVNILTEDRLSDEAKQNRFIIKALPFLPMCKSIRGDKTLISLMLRKVLNDEQIEIKVCEEQVEYSETEEEVRYPGIVGDTLDAFYLGDSYVADVLVYNIHYWSEEACDEHFMEFVKEMDVFREFVQDYFLAIGAELHFDISTDSDGFYLDDGTKHQYLNYNTNL